MSLAASFPFSKARQARRARRAGRGWSTWQGGGLLAAPPHRLALAGPVKEPVYAPHLDNVERICNWLSSGIFREYFANSSIQKQEQLCEESCPARPERSKKKIILEARLSSLFLAVFGKQFWSINAATCQVSDSRSETNKRTHNNGLWTSSDSST